MFLVMGFTGSKAALWKQRFIEAFNKMEQELIDRITEDRRLVAKSCTTYFVLKNQNFHHQRSNSNVINSRYVFSEDDSVIGRKKAQNYNARNCQAITERNPRSWRDQGQDLGLPRYVCKSAKEVARWVQPEMASARSIADELVENGVSEAVAFEIGRAMIVPSKMIIDSGFFEKRLTA
jgi:hypothetical protein